MFARLPNNEIVEYPDELAALMLADPTYGDTPDLTVAEANCLIHAMIGTFYNIDFTFEQNIQKVRDIYLVLPAPTATNLKKAYDQIRNYSANIAATDIGYSDAETINSVFHFQSVAHENNPVTLENAAAPSDDEAPTNAIPHLYHNQ